jgi:hypothetical protein
MSYAARRHYANALSGVCLDHERVEHHTCSPATDVYQQEPYREACRTSLVLARTARLPGRLGANGLCGGLIVSLADAVRYAPFQNGNHPKAIIAATSVLELDMGRNAASSNSALTDAEDTFQRRAA